MIVTVYEGKECPKIVVKGLEMNGINNVQSKAVKMKRNLKEVAYHDGQRRSPINSVIT
jgi:hypothetical protein